MGRHAEGWKLARSAPGAIYRVRFTYNGQRFDRSTGTSDDGEAAAKAAAIYARIVSGQELQVGISNRLEEDIAAFIVDYAPSHKAKQTENVELYFSSAIIPHFRSFARFTPPMVIGYINKRLGCVTRATLRKELSALRLFREWCIGRGVTGLAEIPGLPKLGHAGKRSARARKRVATILSPEQVSAILMAMPETKAWTVASYSYKLARGENKAAFVRGRDPEEPTAEVIAAAAKAGITLRPADVWQTRSLVRLGRAPTMVGGGEVVTVRGHARSAKKSGLVYVRPFFALLWETGLRPYSTVAQLEAGLHYKRGSNKLFISREIDKKQYERTIPLTPSAVEILTRLYPASGKGPIFPVLTTQDNLEYLMQQELDKAAALAGIADPVSVYDFRHSRISQMANSGAPLAGVARLVGHKDISTTAIYVQTSNEAALAALAVADGAEGGRGRKRA